MPESKVRIRTRAWSPQRALVLLQLLLRAWWVFWLVALRRLGKGRRHPAWSFRQEFVSTLLRRGFKGVELLSPNQVRAAMLPTSIHASQRGRVALSRSVLAGVYAEVLTPKNWRSGRATVLYLHGGGYVAGSPATHRDLVSRVAVAAQARCIAIDYRKAPEFPFPAAVEDGDAAYRALLDEGVDPASLFLAGDSAGGGLALTTLVRARDAGLPMPRGAVLISPWVDLTCSGESVQSNARFDYLTASSLSFGVAQYLQGADPRHPHASPLFADLSRLPPLYILSGASELFLSENARLAARAREAGVHVIHEVEEGMVHVYPLFASLVPECAPAVHRIGAFVRWLATTPYDAVPAGDLRGRSRPERGRESLRTS